MIPERLELTPEEMRRLGYRVIDALVEHWSKLPEKSVTGLGGRAELEALLREPLPETGSDPVALVDRVCEQVMSRVLYLSHPRFFAFVPSPANFVSAMADALAAGFNVFTGTWISGAAAVQIELITIDWLRQVFGMPETAGGLFVSGGSVANLTALAAARRAILGDDMAGAVIYCSDQTHSSIDRAVHVLGFQREQLRKLVSDEQFRLPVPALRQAVSQDRAAGRRPFCVVANAGTTNTAAVDPLSELAAFCRTEGLWLHVDGAYGAAAAFSERVRPQLAGIEHADSLSVDPHKWLFQTMEAGVLLVRDTALLKDTFHILPEYLRETDRGSEQVNFANYGIQLTRSFRALKLWLSLKTFGRAAFAQAITHGIEMAEYAESLLRNMPGWEVVTPANLALVTFRHGGTNEQNRQLVSDLLADGLAFLTSTELRGQVALRLCTINPRTAEEDIHATLSRLNELANRVY